MNHCSQKTILTMHSIKLIINLIPTLLLLSCTCINHNNASLPTQSDHNYANWQDWRKDYDETIVGKGGWLSLAGLYWLSEGKNTIGSAKTNNIHFPNDFPAIIAQIEISKNQINLTSFNNQLLVNQQTKQQAVLSVKDKTIMSFANYDFYIIQREIGYAIRLINNQSEKIQQFKGTHFYPFNESWLIPAKLISPAENETLKIPTVYGTTREDLSAGWLEFTINGQIQRLQAVDYGKESPMFVMFSDETSGDTTYGAGRYIEVEWPDENGKTLIDFNRAYNPACAFTSYATCPLTPRQNRLKIAIEAGELDVVH